MDLQHVSLPVEHAAQSLLSDSELRERAAGEWLEKLVGIAPLRVDDHVEFRDDAVLSVRIE